MSRQRTCRCCSKSAVLAPRMRSFYRVGSAIVCLWRHVIAMPCSLGAWLLSRRGPSVTLQVSSTGAQFVLCAGTCLYFAGEATHKEDAYTVHGAYLSGEHCLQITLSVIGVLTPEISSRGVAQGACLHCAWRRPVGRLPVPLLSFQPLSLLSSCPCLPFPPADYLAWLLLPTLCKEVISRGSIHYAVPNQV